MITIIILDAKSDSYIDMKHTRQHFLEDMKDVAFFAIAGLMSYYSAITGEIMIFVPISFILLRMALMSPMYGIFRGFGYMFLGTTSRYDKFMKYLVYLENKNTGKYIKGFPFYTCYIFICGALGFFLHIALSYLNLTIY